MRVSNPKTLKDEILTRLGAPIINIEVTEDQIYSCIDRALELYGEYHFDGTNKSYIAIKIDGNNASDMAGIFDFQGKGVFAVTKILRIGSDSMTWGGGVPYPWVSDMIMSLSGASGGVGYYGQNSIGGNLTYYTQFTQYWQMIQDQFNPVPDYWYNDATGQLKIMSTFNPGEVIFLEVYVKSYMETSFINDSSIGNGHISSGEAAWTVAERYENPYMQTNQLIGGENTDIHGSYNNRWVKDYATTLVKELNGSILAKHQGLQLAGGVTVDGTRLIEEARLEKEVLRQELLLLDAPAPILIG